jgi:hypothetical protein
MQGAYQILPRQGDAPLFDWAKKDPRAAVPSDQESVANYTRSFVQNLLDSGLPKEEQDNYIEQAKQFFFEGCVQENPSPTGALRSLKNLETHFLNEKLYPKIDDKRRRQGLAATVFLFLASAIGLALRSDYVAIQLSTLLRNLSAEMISNYIFVFAASMAGVIASFILTPSLKSYDDFRRQQNRLRFPIFNVLATGLLAEGVGIGLSVGAVTARIGDASTEKIGEDLGVALFVGFLVGLGGSSLGSALISKFQNIGSEK